MSKLAVYHDDTERWRLIEADALLTLAKLPDACVDSIVTDPPYGIDFAGEAWDGKDIRRAARVGQDGLAASETFERWTAVWAAEAVRVLKPGGHLLAFGLPARSTVSSAGLRTQGLRYATNCCGSTPRGCRNLAGCRAGSQPRLSRPTSRSHWRERLWPARHHATSTSGVPGR